MGGLIPRCLAQLKFAEANLSMKESEKASALTVAKKMIRIAPGVLSQFEKIKNPQPNVDAISGSCLRVIVSFYSIRAKSEICF